MPALWITVRALDQERKERECGDSRTHLPYSAPTETALSAGAAAAGPFDGTTRMFNVALFVALGAVNACSVLGSGTAKVTSVDKFIPGIIGPKKAIVPA